MTIKADKTIDIVTVYNNNELYSQMQQSALANAGDIHINFVGINNCNKQYSSAAKALNYAICADCKSDFLIICHQDIIFANDDILRIYTLCSDPQLALWGVAGVYHRNGITDVNRGIISAITMGNGTKFHTMTDSGETHDVFSLDECLIATKRELFNIVKFDETCCDGWHLYIADLCIQCQTKNLPVKCFYSELIHVSNGNVDSEFRRIEKQLAEKWKHEYKIINYSCDWTYTNEILFYILRWCRKIKNKCIKIKNKQNS